MIYWCIRSVLYFAYTGLATNALNVRNKQQQLLRRSRCVLIFLSTPIFDSLYIVPSSQTSSTVVSGTAAKYRVEVELTKIPRGSRAGTLLGLLSPQHFFRMLHDTPLSFQITSSPGIKDNEGKLRVS